MHGWLVYERYMHLGHWRLTTLRHIENLLQTLAGRTARLVLCVPSPQWSETYTAIVVVQFVSLTVHCNTQKAAGVVQRSMQSRGRYVNCTMQVQEYAGCRYVRVDFTWEASGHISAVTHLQAIPDVTLSFGSTDIDRRTLAAFVLLVLLTCTQASVVGFAIWHRLTAATSLWKVFLVRLILLANHFHQPPWYIMHVPVFILTCQSNAHPLAAFITSCLRSLVMLMLFVPTKNKPPLAS